MDRILLEVENLKTYFSLKRGVLKAVDGVSFTVNEGQSVGLVGESGCGKTVTTMSILRLEPKPAAKIVGGKILFKGDDLVKKSEKEMCKIRGSEISLIMQDPITSLNPVFTIGDQIREAIRLHGGVKDKRSVNSRAIEALKQVNISGAETRINDFPHQMSGGMRQRVVGAIAISCGPSLLIADEPTTALDVTTQAQYLRLLRDIQKEKKLSMLFITHDLGIVAKLCDAVCVMYLGKVVERASVRDLWSNPCHPYTIALMKAMPKMGSKVDRLYSIKGMVPSLLELPTGCAFRPRCEMVGDYCRQENPPEVDLGGGHYVRCWRKKG
ncbi:MAG: ABC transporter ATP-binding protein [Pseudomonadota bacterium]